MKQNITKSMASRIMLEFAAMSGLSPAGTSPQRYLWTDAFAVCNLIGLYLQTGDERCRELALLLVDQVHNILGRHRGDDGRTGWISGLDEEEGSRHPTIGGLRIGKGMRERRPGEPFDESLEWDRDGQYYHYLTQWMHALSRAGRVTGDPKYSRWAMELAKTAHARFTYLPPLGRESMYWKMSIDLSYPLVPSMGHHDPLEGFITYSELQAASGRYPDLPDLNEEISDMAGICEGRSWTTDDPLGIGGLLSGAHRMAQLMVERSFTRPDLLENVLDSSLAGLHYYAGQAPLRLPADYRLAFRELGLSIGLHAVERLNELVEQNPGAFKKRVLQSVEGLMQYAPLGDAIEEFWLEGGNRESGTWMEHRNINMVMLATSLAPDGYLSV